MEGRCVGSTIGWGDLAPPCCQVRHPIEFAALKNKSDVMMEFKHFEGDEWFLVAEVWLGGLLCTRFLASAACQLLCLGLLGLLGAAYAIMQAMHEASQNILTERAQTC